MKEQHRVCLPIPMNQRYARRGQRHMVVDWIVPWVAQREQAASLQCHEMTVPGRRHKPGEFSRCHERGQAEFRDHEMVQTVWVAAVDQAASYEQVQPGAA